jgi:hypothetical protein
MALATLHELEKARARLPSAILRLQQLVKNSKAAAQRSAKVKQEPGGAGKQASGSTAAPAAGSVKAAGDRVVSGNQAAAAADGGGCSGQEAAAEPPSAVRPVQLGKRSASKDAEEAAGRVLDEEFQDLLCAVAMSPLTLKVLS